MATKPLVLPIYATDLNYTSGPDIGTPTKIALTPADNEQGNIRGEPNAPTAQKFNFYQNLVGEWCQFLNENAFSTEADEFGTRLSAATIDLADRVLIEDADDSFNKAYVTIQDISDLAGASTLALVLAEGNTSGANDIVMAPAQAVRGTDNTTGDILQLIGGDATGVSDEAGGGVFIGSGAPNGSGTGGQVTVDLNIQTADTSNFVITNDGTKVMEFGFFTAPTNGATFGFLFGDEITDFQLGFPDTTATDGANLIIAAQSNTLDDNGGKLTLRGGFATGVLAIGGGVDVLGGDAPTLAPGPILVRGGAATAGTTDGAPVTISGGTSVGGSLGVVTVQNFVFPGGVTFTMPTTLGAAGSSLTDVAGDGILSFQLAAGMQDLESVLGQGNITGANDIVVSTGQFIRGVDGVAGTELSLRGGNGSAGVGAPASLSGGAAAGGNFVGGAANVTSGVGSGTAESGPILISTPAGSGAGNITISILNSTVNPGGAVSIDGGPAAANDAGGVFITGGDSGAGDGGSIGLAPGDHTGGDPGVVEVTGPGAAIEMVRLTAVPRSPGESRGTYWVRNDNPISVPMFTDNTNNDFVLNAGTDADTRAFNGTVTTTSGTPTQTIATFSTSTDDSVIRLELELEAIDATDDDVATFNITGTFHRDGVSAVTPRQFATYTKYDLDDPTWGVVALIVGQDIQIRVTGDATNNTSWRLVGKSRETS